MLKKKMPEKSRSKQKYFFIPDFDKLLPLAIYYTQLDHKSKYPPPYSSRREGLGPLLDLDPHIMVPDVIDQEGTIN